jgi:hypothetical protein
VTVADIDIQINVGPITTAVLEAFKQANEVLGRDAAQEITSDKWPWPGTTVRQTGVTVGSPRDIRDLSGLIGSYVPTPIPPDAYDHTWSVDYAMVVHEGSRAGVNYPARPWTKEPLEKFPANFERLAKSTLGRVT